MSKLNKNVEKLKVELSKYPFDRPYNKKIYKEVILVLTEQKINIMNEADQEEFYQNILEMDFMNSFRLSQNLKFYLLNYNKFEI